MESLIKDKARVESTIVSLIENHLPLEWDDSEELGDIYVWKHDNEGLLNRLGIKMACGASRVVFWYVDDPTFVIKFDRSQRSDEPSFCQRELEIYESAVAHNLGSYFAKIEFGGYVYVDHHIIPYYAMEYAAANVEKLTSQISSNLKDENADLDSNYISQYLSSMCDDDNITEVFGYDSELEGFLEAENTDDFHFGNFGESADRGWILIDYCGYDSLKDQFYDEMEAEKLENDDDFIE